MTSSRHRSRLEKRVQSPPADRKSTRLNSSHANISYAVFCLKKKKKKSVIRRVEAELMNRNEVQAAAGTDFGLHGRVVLGGYWMEENNVQIKADINSVRTQKH